MDIDGIILFSQRRNEAQNAGRIAQLVEHLPYKQRVIGSNPVAPTMWSGSSAG